ncbi:type 1 fimbrial protein [Pseudomonas sp. MWU12-2115]|uniref:type 1 fimbrial protein n=1 Tax=unclassified Pseudomonas TaxID=196821 RepID=UPI000CD5596A|nr:type 1 fimbrial protein [Pseudomonas sp. MWU12-2020]RBB98319.1 type 1 fimbrial protein [Pseudomonas sp. MWU12-2115]
MNLKTALASVLVLLPLAVCAAPQSTSGEIRFTGQIVDSGCAVERAGSLGADVSRQVEIKPGLQVDVDTYRNACSHQSLPFSMTYQALKMSSDKGIVTITYL